MISRVGIIPCFGRSAHRKDEFASRKRRIHRLKREGETKWRVLEGLRGPTMLD